MQISGLFKNAKAKAAQSVEVFKFNFKETKGSYLKYTFEYRKQKQTDRKQQKKNSTINTNVLKY